MTDLEALECIVVDLVPKAKEHNKKEIEQVRKSLEILDILKKHYDNDSLALSLNSFIVFTIHNDDKDFNKIKEWLSNDK